MLICKKCGHKLSDEQTIKYFKKKFRFVEEHDIPYYCGACLDNASDEEYDEMCAAMDNQEFMNAVMDLKEDLNNAISYDEWAGREYGESRIDVDDTAYELAALGYKKEETIVKSILQELSEVVEEYPTTIGSVMINKKISEIKSKYRIE